MFVRTKRKKTKGFTKKLTIAISKKYKKISEHYLGLLENQGYKFEKIYLSGSVEESFIYNIVDLIIDIVYSGKSAELAGLECYDKIFESDIVMIGNRRDFKEIPIITIKK